MTFNLTISADNADDLSNAISQLAAKFGEPLPVAELGETTEEPKARRTRSKKAETAAPAVDKSEEKSADEDVKTEADAAPEPETKPEPEAKAEPKKADNDLTTETVRQYIISNYLNAFFPSQADKTANFQKILDHFEVSKFKEVPQEQLGDVKAHVDGLIENAAKS